MPSTIGIVASGVQGFSPLDLSPVLWLDASDTSTIVSSGGKVSQWTDKSTNAYAFTQATSTRQPSTGSTTQNGLNVVGFDAQWVTDGNAARWKQLSDGTKYVIAMAWKNTSVPGGARGTNMVLGNSQGNTNTRGIWLRRSSTTNMQHVIPVPGGAAVDNQTANASSNAMVTTLLADPSNATAAQRSQIAMNADTTIGNNIKTTAPSTSNPEYNFLVGSSSYTSTDQAGGFLGWIAELIIVSGTNATEANRVALRNYLNTKWAVY